MTDPRPWAANGPTVRKLPGAALRIEMHLSAGGPPQDVASITLADVSSGAQLGRFTMPLADAARFVVGDHQVVMRGDLYLPSSIGCVAWYLRLSVAGVNGRGQASFTETLAKHRGRGSEPTDATWELLGPSLQPLVDHGWTIDLEGAARSRDSYGDPLRLMARCWLPPGETPSVPSKDELPRGVTLEGEPWARQE